MEIEKDLFKLQDKKYQEFQKKLCPGINNIIGIRIPELRNYAKKINGQIEVNEIPTKYYEEIMLKGMLIGLRKELNLEQIENFIPLINNWAVCDTFCAGLKQIKKNKEVMWNFLQKYINSNKEFEVRFAVVILLDFYIDEEYIDNVLNLLEEINHEGYYAKMAVAWAYSFCFIKFFEKTKIKFEAIKNEILNKNKCKIDQFTYNKAIQKAIESYRLTKEQKDVLRNLKIQTTDKI